MIPKHVILLLSGGMDSVVLLYYLLSEVVDVHCVLFDYGQRHLSELDFAKRHCRNVGIKWTLVELNQVKNIFQRCSIVDGNGSNIVPNRNSVMLNIAAAMAMSSGAEAVVIGCNKDDESCFPDCRKEFIQSLNSTLKIAHVPVEVCAPFIDMTKRQIVDLAKRIKAPYEDSISCYRGGEIPCGRCDACKKREAALA